MLTVIEELHITNDKGVTYPYWRCKCDCGNDVIARRAKIKSGHTKSCGCLQRRKASETFSKHRDSKSPLYVRYIGIKQRCTNPNHKSYNSYGGRGIKLCDAWLNDFSEFKNWSLDNGYADDLQLDRIDTNGDYTPENCRWVSPTENMRNTRANIYIEGELLADFFNRVANENNLSKSCVVSRYYRLKAKGIEINTKNILNYLNITS